MRELVEARNIDVDIAADTFHSEPMEIAVVNAPTVADASFRTDVQFIGFIGYHQRAGVPHIPDLQVVRPFDNHVHTETEEPVTVLRTVEPLEEFLGAFIGRLVEIFFGNHNPDGTEAEVEQEANPPDELRQQDAAERAVQITVFIDDVNGAVFLKSILNDSPLVGVILQEQVEKFVDRRSVSTDL